MGTVTLIFLLLSLFTISGCVVAEYCDYGYYTDEYGTHRVPVRRRVILPDWDLIGDFLFLGALIYGLSHSKVEIYYGRPRSYREFR